MSAIELKKMAQAWQPLAETLRVPRSEREYEQLVAVLDGLIDEVGEDEAHQLASLMDVLGVLIEKYEMSTCRSCGEVVRPTAPFFIGISDAFPPP